jgi:predicted RNA binding protein YcfA (HicA-like mRNA interferase family)
MPRKIGELKADLRRAGFTWRPGKGSHSVWEHDLIPDEVTLSGNDGDDAKSYQEKQVRGVIAKARAARQSGGSHGLI